jgi:ornithine cyclodeaminase
VRRRAPAPTPGSAAAILADKGGAIDWNNVSELGALLVDKQAPRTAGDGIVVFKSVGFGLEDVALAALAYRKAHGER